MSYHLKMSSKKTERKSKTGDFKISASPLSESRSTHYLSGKSLQIDTSVTQNYHTPVPPSSPRELVPDVLVTPLPYKFPALKNVTLPIVREVGVREAIRILSEIFGCSEYQLNLIQFWFLDILADCVWRSQDEFRFPERDQKIILEWILYVFDLIRAQHLNLSRKKLFSLFAEALSIAEDYVESGCASVPLPEEIFSIKINESYGESSESSNTSGCSGSVMYRQSKPSSGSLLAIKFQENAKYFKLPDKTCVWDTDDECLSSSLESLSEDERPETTDETEMTFLEPDFTDESLDEEIEFYKPDMRTPPRFKRSMDESSSIISDSVISEESTEDESKEASWKAAKRQFPSAPCPSEIFDIEQEDHEINEKQQEEKVLQAWFDYHLWQLRKEQMNDYRLGTTFSTTENVLSDENNGNHEINRIQTELENVLKRNNEEAERMKKSMFVNTCVLLAIKKFVFDYFYGSFQYSLVKMAFRYPQHLITQDLNQEWYVPKTFKSELKKPHPKKIKVKKEKKSKPKKEKKEKPKSPKKDKKDVKSAKSSGKSSKKDDKISKKGKKQDKDSKAKEVSKTLIAEEARKKREQEEIEEKRRQAEDDRRYMFPLTEAATDAFFQDIFENWVKPKEKGKPSRDKSSKTDKVSNKDKDIKTDKSSKKGKSERKSDDGKKKKKEKKK